MTNDNQALIEEITERVKAEWRERFSYIVSRWSDDEFSRFKTTESFIEYILFWHNFGNLSLDMMEELGIASVYQIGNLTHHATVSLMPKFNELTFKVYLPKADFARIFEIEKEKREI